MAVDFPDSPVTGQIYTIGGRQMQWDGEAFVSAPGGSVVQTPMPVSGAKVSLATTLTGQNLTSASNILALIDTVEYDDDSWWDGVNDKFVVPAGVDRVDVAGSVHIQNINTGNGNMYVVHENSSGTKLGEYLFEFIGSERWSGEREPSFSFEGISVSEGDRFWLLISTTDTSIDVLGNSSFNHEFYFAIKAVKGSILDIPRTISAEGMTPVAHTVTTADVTLSVNTHNFFTITGLTADRNVVLPAPTAVGQIIEVNVLDGDDDYDLIFKGDTGVSINGGTAAAEWGRLFQANKRLRFMSSSTSNWQVMEDNRDALSFRPRWAGTLYAWYDGSDISTMFQDAGKATPCTNGTTVYTWADKGPNGFDLQQSNATYRPTVWGSGPNQGWGLQFINDYLSNGSFAITNPTDFTIFLVLGEFQDGSGEDWTGIVSFMPASGNDYNSLDGLSINAGGKSTYDEIMQCVWNNGGAYLKSEYDLPLTTPFALYSFNATSGSGCGGHIDRKYVTWGAWPAGTPAAPSGIVVGTRYVSGALSTVNSDMFEGIITDIIIYNGPISTADSIKAVRDYLMHKHFGERS